MRVKKESETIENPPSYVNKNIYCPIKYECVQCIRGKIMENGKIFIQIK